MFNSSMSHLILFVNNPEESAAFYAGLFGYQPVERSPTFVLFALPNGVMLGLWSKHTARPSVQVLGGGTEMCFAEESDDRVDALFHQWQDLGIPMTLAPVAMDGMSRTFVALDPDGHRIRIFCMEKEA
ncbi:Glyoxalase/Bleomycin resistance protein/Dioxygenase family protein [Candidatus Protochlamydia naegleriophila]|uniref:Glyoxalase/Bleomycin resistance protein/Dioxygenase family protein n=1 Tax=Candidatus Protochlamydia naegleriophila TaxID=389348 RepID=A0A0U5JBS0_9BACT|nr:VOC family protein [Candidatus Protochlamydia naegleriophila]CUI16130.1 Glyoxalase/Bleomycin resistance protein/Dioxygenase family protein [Candidatus Protochlamydia naegleriophila]